MRRHIHHCNGHFLGKFGLAGCAPDFLLPVPPAFHIQQTVSKNWKFKTLTSTMTSTILDLPIHETEVIVILLPSH